MLSIVSTPIGNLGDISQRAKEILASCNAIICEDTRVTGKLLQLLALRPIQKTPVQGLERQGRPELVEGRQAQGDVGKKELISFHSFNEHQKLESLLSRLKSGQHLALVCDAGTPGISDPGYLLIAKAADAGIKVEVVPGPSAFLAALSISGLPINQFVYVGFLPLKKGRQKLLESLKSEPRTVVFYESPHRIQKTLSELAEVLVDQPQRPIAICRELTKMHEEVIRATVGKLPDVLKTLMQKGEFVVVLAGAAL